MAESASTATACVVFGGGGHAAAVIDWLRVSGAALNLVAVLDRDPRRWGADVLGVPIVGGDDCLADLCRNGVSAFVVGVGGVGDNAPRARVFEAGLSAGLRPITVVHPTAVVSSWALIGEGTVVGPQAVINARAHVGRNVIVNTAVVVEHDCRIGDHVHLASGALLASTVVVGAGAHVGARAVVRQLVQIGERAVVGAGAVVVKNVLAGQVVAGVPARPLVR
jgi:sugar O-acyltransferase (sialic acid O-acetyltransferase NeuD family)